MYPLKLGENFTGMSLEVGLEQNYALILHNEDFTGM